VISKIKNQGLTPFINLLSQELHLLFQQPKTDNDLANYILTQYFTE